MSCKLYLKSSTLYQSYRRNCCFGQSKTKHKGVVYILLHTVIWEVLEDHSCEQSWLLSHSARPLMPGPLSVKLADTQRNGTAFQSHWRYSYSPRTRQCRSNRTRFLLKKRLFHRMLECGSSPGLWPFMDLTFAPHLYLYDRSKFSFNIFFLR